MHIALSLLLLAAAALAAAPVFQDEVRAAAQHSSSASFAAGDAPPPDELTARRTLAAAAAAAREPFHVGATGGGGTDSVAAASAASFDVASGRLLQAAGDGSPAAASVPDGVPLKAWYAGALNPRGTELSPGEAAALEASFAEFKRANGLGGAADDALLSRDLSQSWAALAHLRDEAAPALAAARARAAAGGG